jgi:hypothetical protein
MTLVGFMPWLAAPFGDDPTGWDLFDAAREAGDNPFFTTELFVDQFSPFFSAPVAIISGVLVIAAGLALILAPRVPQPARATVPAAWGFPAQLAGLIAFAFPLVGLYTLGVVQRDPKLIDPGGGLFLWAGLGAIGFLALVIGCAGKRPKKASG